jgi:hypothetical protein
MIRPEAYRMVLTVAMFFVILPGLLLLGGHPGTAAFTIAAAALAVGVAFTLLVALIIRFSGVGDPGETDHEEQP